MLIHHNTAMATTSDRNLPFKTTEVTLGVYVNPELGEVPIIERRHHDRAAKSSLPDISKEAVKFDQGKPDWSLLPYDSLEEVVKVLEYGKLKYAAWNWSSNGGFKYTRVFGATMRHLLAFIRGEDLDPESGLSHIAHCACNILFLLYFIKNKEKYNTCDDRQKK